MGIRAIVVDTAGTTTDLNFIEDVLFPYSAKALPAFLEQNQHNVLVDNCICDVQDIALEPDASLARVTEILQQWIKEDRKATPLKTLQGLIWKQGYAATSMRDLEKATNLSTGSIYNSFGSKEKLFETSFDYYVDKVIGRRIHVYLEDQDARKGILAFFEDSLNSPPDIRVFGCLLVNTAIESDGHSDDIREKMTLAHKRVNRAMGKALERGIEAGQINAAIN